MKNPRKVSNATREKGYKTLIVDHFFENHYFFSETRGDSDKQMCFNEHGRSLTFGRMLGNSKSTSLKKCYVVDGGKA